MSYSGEAADQVVRLSLNGVEVAAKLSGSTAKQLAIMIYAILKDQKKTKGKIRLTNMLRSGKELKVFAVKDGDLQKFCEEAKKYGVLYCVLKDKNATDGITDIMVRAEDAAKVNRIFTRFGLATVDLCRQYSLPAQWDRRKKSCRRPAAQGVRGDGAETAAGGAESNPHRRQSDLRRYVPFSGCQKPREQAAGRCPVKEARMAEVQHLIQVSDYEQRLMVNGLNAFRNDLIREGKPTEDINALLIKVIDAPEKKLKRKFDRER